MKTYTIDQVQDTLIGEKGTPERDIFEYELQMDLIGKAIKQSRKERNLTQKELGKLILGCRKPKSHGWRTTRAMLPWTPCLGSSPY